MTTTTSEGSKGFLGTIERLGNKVPHPVIMFLYLILIVMVLSHVLFLLGVSVTDEIAVPIPSQAVPEFYEDTTEPGERLPLEPYDTEYEIVTQTVAIRSLLNTEGVRFIFSSFVANFAGFGVIAVTLVAMAGVGVAEQFGMMDTLIRKLVAVAPRSLFTIILVFVGVISSVATDAGYLILIPLGASAFLSLGRHPLAGMAAAFAGVGAVFGVNILITPVDSMITEITNEAIALTGGTPITITANYFFSVASTLVLTLVVALVTTRVIEPRLGKYVRADGGAVADDAPLSEAESKGLRYALIGLLIFLAYILFITLPSGAPLRDPVTDAIIGTTPFMDSLIFIISLAFLISGIGYGLGAGTMKSKNDVIAAVTKTFSGLAGLIFMLLMISQFIAFFNFSNMPTVLAISMAGLLEQANVGALPLLLGMIIVIVLLNVIIPGVVPKWAIFAPVFIPIFIRLNVAPQTVLAAYRVGDSPLNVITPLMVYLPFIVTVAQRYDKDAGLGTVVALMLPYAVVVAVVWILLFILWFVLGIPLGPGYPVSV
jgi:aminobenzoyl-glutamate transport protein